MTEGWTVLIAAHAAGATLAMLLGGYLVLRRRKGDLLHRRVGRIWFVTMYWVAFSSFGIKRLTPGHFSWIHGLSAWTVISLTIAIWAAATHRIDLHRGFVVGSYFGLVGAGIAATAFPQRLVPQTVVHHPVALLVIALQIAAIAWVVVRIAQVRSERAQEPRPASRARATASGGGAAVTLPELCGPKRTCPSRHVRFGPQSWARE